MVPDMPTLYLVPTPIGNLEDITLRALRILKEASLIAAEDTRTSRILLDHYQIKTPLTSYHEHNKLAKLDAIFGALTMGDVALISDAGMPGISDPGYELVVAVLAKGIKVVPLPGANAALCALVASGLPTEPFTFLGFPPRKTNALRQFLAQHGTAPHTLILYESPNRLLDTLQAIAETLGEDRPVVVAREISKLYESFHRGTAAEGIAHFTAHPPRGEIVIVISGAPPQNDEPWDESRVVAALQELLEAGEARNSAVKTVAGQSGWPRREVYALSLRL
jgi:16S rRNA (cytidine1402-2'-O)-methyltransferase